MGVKNMKQRSKPRIPKPEPGTDAGVQLGAFGVPDVQHQTKPKGKAVQVSMDDAIKLAEAKKGETDQP